MGMKTLKTQFHIIINPINYFTVLETLSHERKYIRECMYAYIYIYGDFALNKRAPILNFTHPWPVCESDKVVYVQIYYNICTVVSSVRWWNLLSSSINLKHFRSLVCVGLDTFYRKIHTRILYT